MKAVVYREPRKIFVEEVPDPKIEEKTDAIIKLTTSGICGSDLHVYAGYFGPGKDTVLGHEPMGIVTKVGDGVQVIKEGDRVVIPFNVACGFCSNCIRGRTDACLSVYPGHVGGYYGTPGMPFRGGQAEYMRVPNADWACLKLPGQAFDDLEDDFVLLSDIFPTAYHATELAGVQPGQTVAVFGAGPVGLLSAYCSKIKGASEVYIVDYSETRLNLAKSIGATPINFKEGDPVEQIIKIRKQNQAVEESMPGVMCGIDAVGIEVVDRANVEKKNPTQVLSDLARLVNSTGKIGAIGVYSGNPMANTEQEKKGWLTLPFSDLWFKGITLGMGGAPVKKYQKPLRDLIIEGKAKPSFIVSNHYSIDEVPEAYKEFSKRDKVIKPLIQFK